MANQRIQIFLKHYKDPEGRYTPRDGVCKSDPVAHREGCGQAIRRYVTYPREKGMYFDGEPIVVEKFPPRQDGAVIALVETHNVHFATCPVRKAATLAARDGKAAAAGGLS